MDEAACKVIGASQVIFKARLEKAWTPSRALLWTAHSEFIFFFSPFCPFSTKLAIIIFILIIFLCPCQEHATLQSCNLEFWGHYHCFTVYICTCIILPQIMKFAGLKKKKKISNNLIVDLQPRTFPPQRVNLREQKLLCSHRTLGRHSDLMQDC